MKEFELGTVVLICVKKSKKNMTSALYPYRRVIMDVDCNDCYFIQYVTKGMEGEKPKELAKSNFHSEYLKEAQGVLKTPYLLEFEKV